MANSSTNIVYLPTNDPAEVLERTMKKIDQIKSVVIIIEWNNESFDIDHSQTQASKLALGNVILSDFVHKITFGER